MRRPSLTLIEVSPLAAVLVANGHNQQSEGQRWAVKNLLL